MNKITKKVSDPLNFLGTGRPQPPPGPVIDGRAAEHIVAIRLHRPPVPIRQGDHRPQADSVEPKPSFFSCERANLTRLRLSNH